MVALHRAAVEAERVLEAASTRRPGWRRAARRRAVGSSAISCLILTAARSVTVMSGSTRSWSSHLQPPIVATCPALANPPNRGEFVTHVSRTVERFLPVFVRLRSNLLVSRPDRLGEERVLDNWLPFLIYGVFALVDPRIDDRISRFAFATRPTAPSARADDSVRVGRLDRTAPEAALHGQLLPDGDALHPLRHRDRVPVSARRDPPRARAGSASSSSCSSSGSSSWPTSTSGGRARSNGDRQSAAARLRAAVASACSGRPRGRACSSRRSRASSRPSA